VDGIATSPTLLCAIAAAVLAGPVASAGAVVQSRADPSDAPAGAVGKADLRAIDWDVGDTSATVRVGLDESTYADCTGGCHDVRAPIGVHVLLDTDSDGLADADIAASRNVDGVSVDVALRTLDRTLSSVDCQGLDGTSSPQIATVSTTVSGGIESFAFTFDPTTLPGHLAAFGWAAFAQAPADTSGGPWDVMPDAADPEPAAANPGDRRCDASKTGLSVRVRDGVAFPDALAPPPPVAPDGDGDGVPDSADRCPAEPAATADGCPLTIGPPPPDTTAPTAQLTAKKTQSLAAPLTARVACPDEACTARATGTARVTRASTARVYAIRPATRRIARGGTGTLTLRLSTATRRALRRALRRGRRVTLKLRVSVADAAGNTRTLTRQITLRR
jgi:hypothetical protein